MSSEIVITLGAAGTPSYGGTLPDLSAFQNLSVGDPVAAQVTAQLSQQTYLLSILGQSILAQTDIAMQPGDLLRLMITQLGESVGLKLIGTEPGSVAGGGQPLAVAGLPAPAPHPLVTDAMQLLDALRADVSQRNLQLAASFNDYGIPLTRQALADTIAVLEATPGPSALNAEGAAYLIARGVPLTPASVTAATEMIFQPQAASGLVQQLATGVEQLQLADKPLDRSVTETLRGLISELVVREPLTAALVTDASQGARQAAVFGQLLGALETATAHGLANDQTLVRLSEAIQKVQAHMNAQPQQPTAGLLRVAESTQATGQVTEALQQSSTRPLLTDGTLGRLNRAEAQSLMNFLLTLEQDQVDRNGTIHLLRDLHNTVERMTGRSDVARAVSVALPQPEVGTLLVEIPIGASGEERSAAIKIYYRRGERPNDREERAHAALLLTLPNLGPIRADATLRGSSAAVRFTTDRGAVADALNQHRSLLIDPLSQLGFDAKVSVKVEQQDRSPVAGGLLDGVRIGSGESSIIDTRG